MVRKNEKIQISSFLDSVRAFILEDASSHECWQAQEAGMIFFPTTIKELKLLQENDCLDILLSQVYDQEEIFFRLMSLRFVFLNKK